MSMWYCAVVFLFPIYNVKAMTFGNSGIAYRRKEGEGQARWRRVGDDHCNVPYSFILYSGRRCVPCHYRTQAEGEEGACVVVVVNSLIVGGGDRRPVGYHCRSVLLIVCVV